MTDQHQNDDVDELLAAADRLDARGDNVGRHAAAKLRTRANGRRFATALDEAGAFTNTTARDLEHTLSTDDTDDTDDQED